MFSHHIKSNFKSLPFYLSQTIDFLSTRFNEILDITPFFKVIDIYFLAAIPNRYFHG